MESDRDWLWWGRHDPLWGVLSLPGRKRGDEHAWTGEEILENGRRYFAELLPEWRRYGMGSAHCVEIGCGVGRLTAQLLRVFDRVTAVDISPDMLARARAMLGRDAERVRFTMPPVPEGRYDGFFSAEVFQHFSSWDGVKNYFVDAHRWLLPGATLCFQVPIEPRPFFARITRNRLTWALRRRFRPGMEYHAHPAEKVLTTLIEAGYVDAECRVIHLHGHHRGHPYFFARRAE